MDSFLVLLPMAICFLTLSTLLYLSLRREETELNQMMTFIITFVLIMNIAFILELLYESLETMLVWNVPFYIGQAGSIFCLVVYCLKFLNIPRWADLDRVWVFAIVPVLTVILVISDPMFGLYYGENTVGSIGGLTFLVTSPGLGYYIFIAYALMLIFSLLYVLIKDYFTSVRSNHDIVLLLVFLLSAFMFNVFIHIMIDIPFPSSYSSIVILTFIITLFFVLNDKIANRVASPTFRNALEDVDSGIIILDMKDRPIFSNDMAKMIAFQDDGSLSDRLVNFLHLHMDDISSDEMLLEMEGDRKYFNVRVENLNDNYGNCQARLMILNDIDEIVNSRNDLITIQGKLDLLSSITKHDTLNQLSIISGYTELLLDNEDVPSTQRELLKSIEKASESIRIQMEFLRDYQEVGRNQPQWMDLTDIIERSMGQLELKDISIKLDVGDFKVLMDPLAEKVFVNLLNNTIHHARAKNVSMHTEKEKDNLLLIYEDDGTGVRDEDKERIFEKKFGKNTGLGLFLSRSILDITDMTISEVGVAGQGARFVISIPAQRFRED